LLVVPINFKHMTSLKIISLIFRLMELPVWWVYKLDLWRIFSQQWVVWSVFTALNTGCMCAEYHEGLKCADDIDPIVKEMYKFYQCSPKRIS
jgi:hypothetical protein